MSLLTVERLFALKISGDFVLQPNCDGIEPCFYGRERGLVVLRNAETGAARIVAFTQTPGTIYMPDLEPGEWYGGLYREHEYYPGIGRIDESAPVYQRFELYVDELDYEVEDEEEWLPEPAPKGFLSRLTAAVRRVFRG